jgi:hypothetical protein
MIFRLRFVQKGGHIHCRLFQATAPGHTWQKNGDLVFDEPGWRAFSALMWRRIEMLPEDDTTDAASTRQFEGLRLALLAGAQHGVLPDCDCRNPRCGHKASKHVGPGGECIEAGCGCGPGGWV